MSARAKAEMRRRVLTPVQIIEMIIANPPNNVRAFAREIGVSRAVITRTVRRLEQEGIIGPRRYCNRFDWEEALDEVIETRKAQEKK
jgi:DNA-binding MarR family transcriptional regulator